MPQMAPIYWLFMFFFFLMSFFLFFMFNYFMKPFTKIDSLFDKKKTLISKSWKL
uniref:ATP synthase complex subunit 8 n=2 Tax=Helice TaxID=53324 RepID=A0A162JFY6_9EUCA|nr:ATP synthase F0 subunit 8 [Helice tientsinensis]YP_009346394.1 ATP synthase F0 subunit 8 [Helice latimera]YP_010743782.1 ATP synthase F0 subunit 8 [Helice tridens]ALK01302.1 ATP synthase F0 subunit 8 [Helice tientsinensis]AOR53773.1 ATP synthase F0 subunit 8 [Helice latimera]WET30528.1 ATP synthase F0 subunit 8 [Helice tridens]